MVTVVINGENVICYALCSMRVGKYMISNFLLRHFVNKDLMNVTFQYSYKRKDKDIRMNLTMKNKFIDGDADIPDSIRKKMLEEIRNFREDFAISYGL